VNVATAADQPHRGPIQGVRFVAPRTRTGQRWLDAPVRHKLGAVILLIGIICLPPVVLGVMVNIRLTDARDSTLENAQRLDDLDDLHISVQDSVYAMQYHTVFAFSEPQFVAQYRDAAEPIPVELAAVLADVPPDLAVPAGELATAVEELMANLDELAATPEATLDDAPGDRIVFELDLSTIELLLATFDARLANEQAVDRLETELEAQAVRDRQEVDRLQSVLVLTTAASVVAALVAATGGTYVVTRGIVRRIERLSANGERFLVGERLLPTAASADEIGRLTQTILQVAQLLDERRLQAVRATKAKDDFLSRVSHELKTPLTAMIGFAQLLEEDPDLSPEARAKATDIVTAGHHLHALIEELLDIKAIEAGRLTIATEPVVVRATAEDAVALVQPMAAGRSVVIGVSCPADLVVVADSRRLREVLVNLLSNAVKYNREGGHANLTALRHDDDTVRISVTDTGPGISPADKDVLFEPFERIGAANTTTGGSGVGLTLTKNIVEAMDGSIDLTSSPGEGSTFWVDLPAAHPPAGDGDGDTPPAGDGDPTAASQHSD
jgi:signal transduction histidine kinase